MTADVKLLPLPEYDLIGLAAYSGTAMNHYARACVEANTEALRAEVERLQSINSGLCRKSNYYLTDSARWQDRAERMAEALREARHYIDGNRFPGVVAKIDALHPTAAQADEAASD